MRTKLALAGAAVLGLVFAAAGLGGPPPPPMNITVGTCPHATFTSIQAAVTAANPGAKITVCPGTYTEQVKIPAGKDNLTLQSQKPLQAVIQAPATMSSPKAIVEITGSQNVDVAKFTIAGPGGTGCDSLEYGVRVDGGGSATIEQNHITHIRDNPFSGCQNGVAVQVGRGADSTTGSATIRDNTIDDFQKNGITVSNTGSSATVQHNTVTGAGPTAAIAQNGIQISGGAAADVRDNTVSGEVYTGPTYSSTGILLFGANGTVNIENNKVSGADTGIYDYASGSQTTIKNNQVSASTYDGITVDSDTGATVQNNNSHDNGEYGYGLYNAVGNTLDDNKATSNAQDGFFVDSGSTGNTIRNGQAKSNAPNDCEDKSSGSGTAGTGNTWMNVHGTTSSPAGICKK
jgi:parallel beta-helix repeat protein